MWYVRSGQLHSESFGKWWCSFVSSGCQRSYRSNPLNGKLKTVPPARSLFFWSRVRRNSNSECPNTELAFKVARPVSFYVARLNWKVNSLHFHTNNVKAIFLQLLGNAFFFANIELYVIYLGLLTEMYANLENKFLVFSLLCFLIDSISSSFCFDPMLKDSNNTFSREYFSLIHKSFQTFFHFLKSYRIRHPVFLFWIFLNSQVWNSITYDNVTKNVFFDITFL